MVKKKGGQQAGGSSRKVIDRLLTEYASRYTPPSEEEFEVIEDRYVKLHLRLIMWQHLSFSLRVLDSTPLVVIEQKILERHEGTIHDLQLWKDMMLPETKISDLTKTLKDVYHFDENSPYSVKKRLKYLEQGEITMEENAIIKEIDEVNEMEGGGVLNLKDIDYHYECIMYYNFEPFDSNCPLLARGPQLIDVLKDDELKKRKRHDTIIDNR